MFNFIIKAIHENGATLEMSLKADSFTEALSRIPADNLVTLTVIRSPICH